MNQDRTRSRRASTVGVALVVPLIALIAVFITRWVEGPSVTHAAKTGANTIVIRSFSFQPARLEVAKGATVTVTNADQVTHTLTSRDGSFDTRQLGAGKSARFVVHRSGTFPFACQIHPFMHGTLVVR